MPLEPFLECEDHTVSRETFSLFRDSKRDLLVTLPQPPADQLYKYYESEDYISHTDSRRNLIEYLYQQVKGFSLKRKLNLVNRGSIEKGRLLDIGCGTGDFLRICLEAGWTVTGIEPNESARALAKEKVVQSSIFPSLEELSSAGEEKFEVITLWHVLEHLPDLYEQIRMIKSLLKPNGSLFIAVPNHNSHDAGHYKSFWAAYDVPRHLWHFSRTSIKCIFSDFDMSVVEELPLHFDSFYVSLLSEKYKSGSQKFLSAFYRGLRSNLQARSTGEYSSIIYWLK